MKISFKKTKKPPHLQIEGRVARIDVLIGGERVGYYFETKEMEMSRICQLWMKEGAGKGSCWGTTYIHMPPDKSIFDVIREKIREEHNKRHLQHKNNGVNKNNDISLFSC